MPAHEGITCILPPITARTHQEGWGGVFIKSPGDLCIFDPNEVALLQGTHNLNARITHGASYTNNPTQNIVDTPPTGVKVTETQHFLEYLDSNDEVPLNFAKPQAPVTATILGRAKLITDDAPGDIEHIVMRLPVGFHYVEGECLFLNFSCITH